MTKERIHCPACGKMVNKTNGGLGRHNPLGMPNSELGGLCDGKSGWQAVSKPTCDELTRGSIYSRKGGNRYEPCTFMARFIVSAGDSYPEPERFSTHRVCAAHLRKYRTFNERLWQTDDVLKRDRRPAFYDIKPFSLTLS